MYKYEITAEGTIQMPIGAEILSVAEQEAKLYIWALVNPLEEKEPRDIVAVFTGHELPELDIQYIGTIHSTDSGLVWHVFEKLE